MSVAKTLSMPTSIAVPDSPAVVMQRIFTDIDERSACEVTSDFWQGARVIRLTNERYESRLAGIHFADLALGAEYCQGAIRRQGALAQDTLYLTFTSGKLSIMGNRPQPTLNIIGPGTQADATQHGEINFHSVYLHGPMLTRLLAGKDGEFIAQRWLAPGLYRPSISELDAGWLYQLLNHLAGLIATVPMSPLTPAALRLVRNDVFAATSALLLSAEPELAMHSAPTASRRRALALAAEELIWSQPSEVFSIADVCDTLDTSIRTLQLAFQEQFGVGFQAFLRAVRLRQVHAAILRVGDRQTLATIATEHGFWHLGRFTQYYRQLFGCAPSTTRRRVWGDRRVAESS